MFLSPPLSPCRFSGNLTANAGMMTDVFIERALIVLVVTTTESTISCRNIPFEKKRELRRPRPLHRSSPRHKKAARIPRFMILLLPYDLRYPSRLAFDSASFERGESATNQRQLDDTIRDETRRRTVSMSFLRCKQKRIPQETATYHSKGGTLSPQHLNRCFTVHHSRGRCVAVTPQYYYTARMEAYRRSKNVFFVGMSVR